MLRLPLSRHLLRLRDLCRCHSRGETISAPGGAGADVGLPRRIVRRRQVIPFVGRHVVLQYAPTGIVHDCKVVLGRRVAVLFTKTYGRVLAPGLSALDARLPEDVAARCEVGTTWRSFERALDDFIQLQLVAP